MIFGARGYARHIRDRNKISSTFLETGKNYLFHYLPLCWKKDFILREEKKDACFSKLDI